MVVIYSNGRKASCGRRYWRQGRCLVGLWTLFWLLQLCQWSRKQGHWLRVRMEEAAFWVAERGGGVQAPSHSAGEWRDSECAVWWRTFLTLVVTHLKWVWAFLWPYPVAQVWYRSGRELELTQAVVLPNKETEVREGLGERSRMQGSDYYSPEWLEFTLGEEMRENIKERKNSEKAVASGTRFWVCRWRVPALITRYLFKAQSQRSKEPTKWFKCSY